MKIRDALNLMGSIPERDFAELIELACDLANARSEIEMAQLQVEEAIRRGIAGEIQKTQAEASLRLLEIRTGIGS